MYVTKNTSIHTAPAAVWNVLKDFQGLLKWFPGIMKCAANGNGLGCTRRLHTANNEIIHERLEAIDDDGMTLSYRVRKESAPTQDHLVVISVEADSDASTVNWTCSCASDDENIQKSAEEEAESALKALKHHCELESTRTPMKKLIQPDESE